MFCDVEFKVMQRERGGGKSQIEERVKEDPKQMTERVGAVEAKPFELSSDDRSQQVESYFTPLGGRLSELEFFFASYGSLVGQKAHALQPSTSCSSCRTRG